MNTVSHSINAISPPDFVIAGCAKSGTTALSVMIDQHPDVYMSDIKETNFFIHGYDSRRDYINHNGKRVAEDAVPEHFIDSIDKYKSLFDGATSSMLCGEASPRYLLDAAVPQRLQAFSPDVKVVLILRNPADVVFANFIHQVRDRAESVGVDNTSALLDTQRYNLPQLHPFAKHLDVPAYATHLPAWLDTFGTQQLHIMVYEEFIADRRQALSSLFHFLGLRDDVTIDVSKQVNISGLPKNNWLHGAILGSVALKQILRPFIPTKRRRHLRLQLEALNAGQKPVLDLTTRNQLDELFKKDVAFVERVLGRPMTRWCASGKAAVYGMQQRLPT